MIVVWIVIGVVVLALAGWAFYPRRRGVVDGAIGESTRNTSGRANNVWQNHR